SLHDALPISYYLLIDSGANIASKPEHMAEYGRLGSDIAEQLLDVKNPRIGLLNIGSEASKGNDFTKAVYRLLDAEKDLNFTGNVEPTVPLNGASVIRASDCFTIYSIWNSMEVTEYSLTKFMFCICKNNISFD